MRNILLFLALISTGACAESALQYTLEREHSSFVTIPAGSTLKLNNNALVPAQLARFYMQAGEIKPFSQIDLYYPNCSLLVNNVEDTAQEITADIFTIYRVERTVDMAQSGTFFRNVKMRWVDNGGPSQESWTTILYLRSEKQPQVRLLRCEHWEDPTDARHLTIDEIRKTLGDVMSLEIPHQNPAI